METRFRTDIRGLTLVCQKSKLAIPLSSKSKWAATNRQTEKLGRPTLNREMGCDAPGGTKSLKEVKRHAR
jgi:hypothetical protein